MEKNNATMRKLSHCLHRRHFPHTHMSHSHTVTVTHTGSTRTGQWGRTLSRTYAAEFTPQANDALR